MPLYQYIRAATLSVWLAACASPPAPTVAAGGPPAQTEPPATAVSPKPAPATPPAGLTLDDMHTLGNRKATLALIEFADLQCPVCRRFHLETLPQIKKTYIDTGKLRYVYKEFPLPNHPQAMPASIAAYCAGVQGKYFPMQVRLYEQQQRLGPALYTQLAKTLGLDLGKFDACLKDDAAQAAVDRDVIEGDRLGVDVTPTFILARVENGRVSIVSVGRGIAPYQAFETEIDALLGKK